jgi:hypothetical protein
MNNENLSSLNIACNIFIFTKGNYILDEECIVINEILKKSKLNYLDFSGIKNYK